VLSHWPHVAEQVQQQVAELVSKCERTRTQVRHLVSKLVEQHVASVKALLGNGLSSVRYLGPPLVNTGNYITKRCFLSASMSVRLIYKIKPNYMAPYRTWF